MIFNQNQNWRTSQLPFSLSLANRVNTGVSIDFPSGGLAERQRWASRGFQGYGPRIQYPNRGMDGLGLLMSGSAQKPHGGCGCGCGGHGNCGHIPNTGVSGLAFDGTTLIVGLVGAYALYAMFMQGKQKGLGGIFA